MISSPDTAAQNQAEVAGEKASPVEPAITSSEGSTSENIFAKINGMAQEKAKVAEERSLGIMIREHEKSGSVAGAFSSVVGQYTTADNISCCYNMVGAHAAEERFFSDLLEEGNPSEDERLVYDRMRVEAADLRLSRELIGKAIAADALTDARIVNGTISPDHLDDGEYIFGHQDSDAVLDEVTFRYISQVIAEVEVAMPEWQQTASNMERVFSAFVPPEIREFVASGSFSMGAGKNSLNGEGIPKSVGEKLTQALKDGNKNLFRSASRAVVTRSALIQGYLEVLHYHANYSLLRTLEERKGELTLEERATLVS